MSTDNKRECKCDLRTRLVGDGCAICNPELAKEMQWKTHATGEFNYPAPPADTARQDRIMELVELLKTEAIDYGRRGCLPESVDECIAALEREVRNP